MDNKTDLRIRAKSIRKNLDIESLSNEAVNIIRTSDLYKSSKNILIYYPFKYELNLLKLLEDDKNFYLPKVCGNDLLVCPYSNDLVKSKLNICEPCTNPIDANKIELAIVPALMADKQGFRLGYGGGFYDRFLAKYPKIRTICPIAKELFIKDIMHDNFDVRIDNIIVI